MEEKRPNHRPQKELKTTIKLDEQFYTINELASILKVHPNSIRNGIKDGRIKAEKFGKVWRIRKKEIEK